MAGDGRVKSKVTDVLRLESGWHVLYCPVSTQKCRAADRGSGSGSSLPGLVLLGEPLHPILELRAEVADQTLGGGRQALGETESQNLPVLGSQHRPHQ